MNIKQWIKMTFMSNCFLWAEKTEVWGFGRKTMAVVTLRGGQLSSHFKPSRSWPCDSVLQTCLVFTLVGPDQISSRGSSPGWVQPHQLFSWCSSLLWKYRHKSGQVWLVDVHVVPAGFKDLKRELIPWPSDSWLSYDAAVGRGFLGRGKVISR